MSWGLRISVITVCLNAAPVIEQTLKSVLAQNCPGLEYIIIDGGSTDGTLDIISKYKTRLSRLISEPDKGIYDAFNKGISLAAGDIVGILNAGDLYSPWALTAAAEAAEAHSECGVFYGRMVIADAVRKRWVVYSPGNHEFLLNNMSIPHPATFVRKSMYERHGLFDDSYAIAGDWELMLRFYLAGERFYPIDKVLAAFDNTGLSSVPSRRLIMENRRVYFKYLGCVSAFRKTLKMECRYWGRKAIGVLGAYRFYVSYRDKKLLHVETSGAYTDYPYDMWELLSSQGLGGSESLV